MIAQVFGTRWSFDLTNCRLHYVANCWPAWTTCMVAFQSTRLPSRCDDSQSFVQRPRLWTPNKAWRYASYVYACPAFVTVRLVRALVDPDSWPAQVELAVNNFARVYRSSTDNVIVIYANCQSRHLLANLCWHSIWPPPIPIPFILGADFLLSPRKEICLLCLAIEEPFIDSVCETK